MKILCFGADLNAVDIDGALCGFSRKMMHRSSVLLLSRWTR
jgi:hypothetical protein